MAQNQEINKELVIQAQIKTIVNTVLENCKKESECNSLLIPLEDYEHRVSYYTGLPKEELFKLLENKPTENSDQSYDLVQRIIIMQTLLKFYKTFKLPNFQDLYAKVKVVFPTGDIVQFRRALTSMGFDYRKTINGMMIAEDPKLTFERYHYLKKIKKVRSSNVGIYYLEERYIDKKFAFNKPDFVNDPLHGKNDANHIWEGFYLYHVLSDSGLDHHFITNKISKEVHNKWVIDNLLKLIKPGCAIVIDNHPLHGELVDDTVTRYHSKADMLNWLRKKSIPCSENMCKAELYDLISRCNKPTKTYDFDQLLKIHGHEVLRLPTGCNALSPTHLFWVEISKRMPFFKKNSAECTLVELEDAIIPTINETHKGIWEHIKQKVIYSEQVLEKLYTETEEALEYCDPFDVKNIDQHAKIPEYFYLLDGYC